MNILWVWPIKIWFSAQLQNFETNFMVYLHWPGRHLALHWVVLHTACGERPDHMPSYTRSDSGHVPLPSAALWVGPYLRKMPKRDTLTIFFPNTTIQCITALIHCIISGLKSHSILIPIEETFLSETNLKIFFTQWWKDGVSQWQNNVYYLEPLSFFLSAKLTDVGF